MLPTLFEIGPLPIHAYGLLIAVGFLIAVLLMRRDARKVGIDPDTITDTAFWVLLLGIIGTRLLHIVMFPENYSWSDPVGWIAIWRGGLVFQGAIPPAIAYCIYALRKEGVSVWGFADVVVPYVPLAHAFGRLGCFMNGCCYGSPTEMPWGVCFRRVPADLSEPAIGSPVWLDHVAHYGLSPDAVWTLPVHPTQLYSALGLALMCGFLLYLRKSWRPFIGFTFPLYLMFYGGFRFVVEFFRGDHNPIRLGIFSDQQVFSLLMVVCGAVVYAWLRRRAARRPTETAPTF
jgi:phosphatidylglycerol:prolipoprotein diacylglycerol transferase